MGFKDYLKEVDDSKIEDEIGTFYCVTKPTPVSGLIDIMFETNIPGMMIQSKGGLEARQIYGLYKDENKATSVAKKLLEQRGTNEF
jgi:hypothetical protein